jgi:hypothetical protein
MYYYRRILMSRAWIDCLIDCIVFYVLRRQHWHWRATCTTFRDWLDNRDLLAVKDLFRATPALTQTFIFDGPTHILYDWQGLLIPNPNPDLNVVWTSYHSWPCVIQNWHMMRDKNNKSYQKLIFLHKLLMNSVIVWFQVGSLLIYRTVDFPWMPTDLTLWPWPWCLIYLLKTLSLNISFEWYGPGL